jgi:hypothetical protein
MIREAIVAVVAASMLVACGGDPQTPARSATSSTESTSSGSGTHDDSQLACRRFRNVMGDVADGVLTDAEIRDQLKEVDDNAVIATEEIQRAARSLLAAATTGTVDQFVDAASVMSDACRSAGF